MTGGYLETVLPHVDEILSQGHTLSIACDGDGSVKVGWSISVLTVRNSDHCSADLSEKDNLVNLLSVRAALSTDHSNITTFFENFNNFHRLLDNEKKMTLFRETD